LTDGRIRVALADDQTLVRQGIRSLLELTPDLRVVAEASDGAEALRVLAEGADNGADLAEELLRDRVCALDRLFRAIAFDVARELELEAQRGEMMAETVVEIPRDAEPLRRACAVREELARREELRVSARQLGAGVGLASRQARGAEREELEAAVGRGGDEARVAVKWRRRKGRRHCRRLGEDPRQPRALADDERRLPGDDDEERSLEPGVSEREDDERGDRLRGERRRSSCERSPTGRCEDEREREDDVRGAPRHRSRIEMPVAGRPRHDLRQPRHGPRREPACDEDPSGVAPFHRRAAYERRGRTAMGRKSYEQTTPA
jgi:CheY-like chemotaxis protein